MSKNVKLIALAIDKNFSALFSMFETQPFWIGDFYYFTALIFFARQQVELQNICLAK